MFYLLGASGYVGSAFERALRRRGLAFRSLSRRELAYDQPETLTQALRADKVRFLINAAGYTGKPNVDACEKHKAACLEGNAVLPGKIALACAQAGIPWGHVSSGCIYSGSRADGSGFCEEDPPNFCFRRGPCSFYSGTKALGEEVLADQPGVYIWRLRIPFNEVDSPRNYLSKLLRYEQLLDATNSISQLDEFCEACLDCYLKDAPVGTYHVTNPGQVTTREVVDLLLRSALPRKNYRFFKDEAEFMALAAHAPRSNCVLDSRKLGSAGIVLTEVHEAIERALRAWRSAS